MLLHGPDGTLIIPNINAETAIRGKFEIGAVCVGGLQEVEPQLLPAVDKCRTDYPLHAPFPILAFGKPGKRDFPYTPNGICMATR